MQKNLFALSNGFSLWISSTIWLSFLPVTSIAQAQSIIPDATLPTNSIVTQNNGILTITGGTTAGTNLFHSFDKFSVSTGEIADFANNLSIKNIVTRVTGNSISNIDGLIRTNGNTNLFLLNPQGIIFGANAALNIEGSFFASTADAWQFTDKSTFSATNTNSSVLSISTPIGVQWGKNPPGSIANSGNLVVGKNLFFAAANISSTGKLSALDGNMDMIAKGDINLDVANAKNTNFNSQEKINTEFSKFTNFQEITSGSQIIAQSPVDDTRNRSQIDNSNLSNTINLTEKNKLSVTEFTVIDESTISNQVKPTYSEVNENPYQRQPSNIPNISIVSVSISSIKTINQFNQACPAQAKNNSFIFIGRGGLPTSSKEALNIGYGWIDWQIQPDSEASKKLDFAIKNPLIEATNLQVDASGKIQIVAISPQNFLEETSLNNISVNRQISHDNALPCHAIIRGSVSG
jgi:filamentous hemagglutinin family protein